MLVPSCAGIVRGGTLHMGYSCAACSHAGANGTNTLIFLQIYGTSVYSERQQHIKNYANRSGSQCQLVPPPSVEGRIHWLEHLFGFTAMNVSQHENVKSVGKPARLQWGNLGGHVANFDVPTTTRSDILRM